MMRPPATGITALQLRNERELKAQAFQSLVATKMRMNRVQLD